MPKVRDAIRMVERDGWHHVTTRGSYRRPLLTRGVVARKTLTPTLSQREREKERPRFWRRGVFCKGRHPVKPGKVTIPGKPGDDVGPKLWASIMNQAGLARERR